MTDILDQIDQAIGCQQCGGPFPEDPKLHVSDDFCGPDCQQAWHAARSAGEIADGGRGVRDIWQETMDAIDMLPRSLWSGRINIASLAYPAQGGCTAEGCGSDAPWAVSVRTGRWVVHEMKICDEHQVVLEDRIGGSLDERLARLRRLPGMVALRRAATRAVTATASEGACFVEVFPAHNDDLAEPWDGPEIWSQAHRASRSPIAGCSVPSCDRRERRMVLIPEEHRTDDDPAFVGMCDQHADGVRQWHIDRSPPDEITR